MIAGLTSWFSRDRSYLWDPVVGCVLTMPNRRAESRRIEIGPPIEGGTGWVFNVGGVLWRTQVNSKGNSTT